MPVRGYLNEVVASVAGDVRPAASVTVRRAADNALASLFDLVGSSMVAKDNPFSASATGEIAFFADAGVYSITVEYGGAQTTVQRVVQARDGMTDAQRAAGAVALVGIKSSGGLVLPDGSDFVVGGGAVSSVAGRTGEVTLETADLGDWDTATAGFLTSGDIPDAPVSSVAGRTGAVMLETADLGDWDTATAGFGSGGGTGVAVAARPDDGPGSISAADYFYQTPELDTAAYRSAGGAPRFAGATPWAVYGSGQAGDVMRLQGGALIMYSSKGGWDFLSAEQPVPITPWKRRVSIDAWLGGGGNGTGIYVVDVAGHLWHMTLTQSNGLVQIVIFAKPNRAGSNWTTINEAVAIDPGSVTLEIEWTGAQYVFRYCAKKYYGPELMIEYRRFAVDYYGIGEPAYVGISCSGGTSVACRAFDGT